MCTNQGQYSYSPKGDHLTIFKGKKKLHTPNGYVVTTYTPELAEHLIALLEKDTDNTSCASTLCYHYTYCDITAQYNESQVREDVKECLKSNLYDDPLLMFKSEEILGCIVTPDELTEEQYNTVYNKVFSDFTEYVSKLNIYQLVSAIVIYVSFDSMALSWRFIKDIINNDAANKEQFINSLKEFCKIAELECPKDIDAIIDAFTYYYNLKG